ncbi:YfiR family protein [Janthinobacterium sp. 17J80-10]|uniref:YfiR family protein n=1 Tax=Janthinobacterium sp. 17J80-10 TaxID=2497863 RepID=UPI00100564FF|nr:YfiR family protein [Janthinobacterium sp. 17J80-10]QAU34518.1 YfiR family protein [Janthinobacterium sp. 17J80-10]
MINSGYLLKLYVRLRLLLKGSLLLHVLALAFLSSAMAPACLAQTSVLGNPSGLSEERIKAAFLFRFIGYVDWPATAFSRPDSPYIVGVLRADGIAEELTLLSAGRTIGSRPVIVRRLQANDSLNGLHILFVGAAERGRMVQSFKSLQQQPVLLVSDADDALAQGSMINFRIVDERVRFEVALTPAEQSGLKLSSRMLGVAHSVIKGPQ